MSQTKTIELLHQEISFRKATVNDVNILIDIIGDYYQKLNLSESAMQKGQAPWIWMSDQNVSFTVMLIGTTISGFFVARHIKLNSHLHTFFVSDNFRGRGLGKTLLIRHWKEALSNARPPLTLTLHTHKVNQVTAGFYTKFGYKKLEQTESLPLEANGFGAWANNCRLKDRWPLKVGIELYGIRANQIKKYLEPSRF
ncbi:GNAT family N-acetyltransferase [Alphaproteobacteria bacterium]|nr:GNAT family N-acetyltransferase [Alphaproteobacteria bacterium]